MFLLHCISKYPFSHDLFYFIFHDMILYVFIWAWSLGVHYLSGHMVFPLSLFVIMYPDIVVFYAVAASICQSGP